MDSPPPARRKFPRALVVNGALALAALAVAALVWHDEARVLVETARGLVGRAVEAAGRAGPLPFFCALAVLPAFGMPALAFTLTAGPLFGKTLGMPAVLALTLAAMTVNMALAWWLARHALRPQVEGLVTRLGHRIPQVPPGDETALIVLLRVTPGVPFFVQNWLMGLAEIPFGKYMAVSCLTAWPHAAAWVFFGEKLKEGRGALILLAVLLLAATAAGANLARHHYGKKRRK